MSVLPGAGPVFSIVRSSVVENISLCEIWVESSVIQWWNFTSVDIQVFYFTTFMLFFFIISRGGVEDTRLEAKTKDTKKSKAKDSLSEDRHSRGQGQECSRPRTQAQVLSKKKKVFTKIFQAITTKKRFPKNFSSAPQNFSNSKNSAVLEPRTGQFSRT